MAARRQVTFGDWVRGFFDGKGISHKQLAAALDKDPGNFVRELDVAGEDSVAAFRLGWQLATVHNSLQQKEF